MFFKKSNSKAPNEQAGKIKTVSESVHGPMDTTEGPLIEQESIIKSSMTSEEPRGAEINKNIDDIEFSAYGRVLSIMGRQDPFMNMSLRQIAALVGPAISSGKCVIVNTKNKTHTEQGFPAAFVLWAMVSVDVDAKLSDIKVGQISLLPEDWNSGDIPWLILSAGNQDAVNMALKAILAKLPDGRKMKSRFTSNDGKQNIGLISLETTPNNQS